MGLPLRVSKGADPLRVVSAIFLTQRYSMFHEENPELSGDAQGDTTPVQTGISSPPADSSVREFPDDPTKLGGGNIL